MRTHHWARVWRVALAIASTGLLAEAAFAEAPRSARQIYHDYCSVCHGDSGDGRSQAQGSMTPPPKDFSTPAAAVELTRERMLASVSEGRPGTAMTPWKKQLSQDEIAAVVDYIRERMMMPVATEDAARGRHLYATTCSVCHGDDGRGARWTMTNLNPPPRNFTQPEFRAQLNREQMIHVATFGKADTAMPGFGTQLTPDEIAAVVDYVLVAFVPPAATLAREAGGQAARPQRSVYDETRSAGKMDAPMPNGLLGDTRRGIGLYMANCATCHGTSGDGRGPRAYFILPKPRNFQHPASRATFDRPTLYNAVARGRLGTEMPAWDTVLTKQQIADVSEYVFQTFIIAPGRKAAGPAAGGTASRAIE
ncbi:MAG: c-type cytochrome [Deltaproteobacteria bacterium]|nr:c-type cytochrome [Deltaproteobacteria bacterium]